MVPFKTAVFDITTVRNCNLSYVRFIVNELLKTILKERETQLHYLEGRLSRNV